MEDLKRLVEKMNDKLDQVNTDIGAIKVVQVEQAADLKHHIYRTDLAEARLELLQSQVTPLSKLHERAKGVFQVLGAVGSGLTLAFGAVKVFEFVIKLL